MSALITDPLLQTKVNKLLTDPVVDWKGRRIVNAGNALSQQDYVTLYDLLNRLAASAYADTTDASNISKGRLNPIVLPNPGISNLGGIKSIAEVAHKFIQYIDNFGNPVLTQPAFTDISGSISGSQIPAAYKPASIQTSPSRAIGSTYQNTNSTPLFAAVTVTIAGAGANCAIYADSSSTPTTLVGNLYQSIAGQLTSTITFIVLPNYYYKVVQTAATISLVAWLEWY